MSGYSNQMFYSKAEIKKQLKHIDAFNEHDAATSITDYLKEMDPPELLDEANKLISNKWMQQQQKKLTACSSNELKAFIQAGHAKIIAYRNKLLHKQSKNELEDDQKQSSKKRKHKDNDKQKKKSKKDKSKQNKKTDKSKTIVNKYSLRKLNNQPNKLKDDPDDDIEFDDDKNNNNNTNNQNNNINNDDFIDPNDNDNNNDKDSDIDDPYDGNNNNGNDSDDSEVSDGSDAESQNESESSSEDEKSDSDEDSNKKIKNSKEWKKFQEFQKFMKMQNQNNNNNKNNKKKPTKIRTNRPKKRSYPKDLDNYSNEQKMDVLEYLQKDLGLQSNPSKRMKPNGHQYNPNLQDIPNSTLSPESVTFLFATFYLFFIFFINYTLKIYPNKAIKIAP